MKEFFSFKEEHVILFLTITFPKKGQILGDQISFEQFVISFFAKSQRNKILSLLVFESEKVPVVWKCLCMALRKAKSNSK